MLPKKTYNPAIHHRRSIRLHGYDYSKEGIYFITMCCQDMVCRFGHIKNGEVILNDVGIMVCKEWAKTTKIRKEIEIHEYVVMPNHFHAIVKIVGANGIRPNNDAVIRPNNDAVIRPNNDAVIRPNNDAVIRPNNDAVIRPNNDDDTDVCRRGEWHSPVCHTFPCHEGVCHEGVCHEGVCHEGVCHTPLQFRSPSKTVGALVRGFKSSVTKQLGFSVWQRNYWENIIRNEQSYQRIAHYIINNPANWEKDTFYTQ